MIKLERKNICGALHSSKYIAVNYVETHVWRYLYCENFNVNSMKIEYSNSKING